MNFLRRTTAAMKKRRFPIFLGGFLVLLLLALGAFAWYCHIPIKDPAALTSIETRVAAMLAARAKIPPQDNGFEALRPIWGYKTEPTDAARKKRLSALNDFCQDRANEAVQRGEKSSPDQFRVAGMRQLLKTHGPKLLAAEQESLQEYPALKAALEKPYFFHPTELRVNELVPNYLAIRSACQFLAVLGTLRAAQGRPDEAIEPLLLGLRMGARLSENGGTMANAIGVACASLCVEPLQDILNEGQLSPERCRQVAQELAALPLGPQQFLLAADSELVMGVKALRSVETPGQEPPVFQSPPILGPLFAARERGLLVNLYLSLRPQIEKLEIVAHPELEKEYAWDPGVELLMPNTYRLEAWYKFLLVRVTALKAMATLAAGQPLPEGTGLDYKPAGKGYELSYSADFLKLVGEESGTVQFHPGKP
jgi:hypothetical protein